MTEPIVLEEKLFDLLEKISHAKEAEIVQILHAEAGITPAQLRAFLEKEGVINDPSAISMLIALEKITSAPLSQKSRGVVNKVVGGENRRIKPQDGTKNITNQTKNPRPVTASNKATLIAKLVEDAGITKTQANLVLDSFVEAVTKTLRSGGKVTLVGFGTFSTSKRAARTGRNPQTGAILKIKAKKVAKFKASKELSIKI